MPPRSRIVGLTVARRDFGHAQGCNLLCGGKRDGTCTQELADDLRTRILNRPQIMADGHAPYIGAIEAAFWIDVDFATITKKYVDDSNLPDAAHRYSPGHVAGVERTVIRGRLNPENISTSYVERFNLSSRMQMRRWGFACCTSARGFPAFSADCRRPLLQRPLRRPNLLQPALAPLQLQWQNGAPVNSRCRPARRFANPFPTRFIDS